MSAKKFGRFTAGLFVAVGLAFGGLVSAGGAAVAAPAATASGSFAQLDFDWS